METTKTADSAKGMTKTDFIRSLPDRTPAKEVVAKAKAAGLELTEKFVWTVQGEMRNKSSKPRGRTAKKSPLPKIKAKPAAKAKPGEKPAIAAAKQAVQDAPVVAGGAADRKLRALIVELGTAKADEVFHRVRRELDALLHS